MPAQLQDTPGVTAEVGTGVSVADLNVDRSQGPLADVRVRQAISYAIDRHALSLAATDDLTDVIAVQPYSPGSLFHFEELNDAYPYDPEKAKQLLAEAGHADGLTLRGVSLDGNRYVNNGVIVADQLKQVGIEVSFEAKALPDATKSFYTDHQYDIMSTGMNSGPDWITIYRRLMMSNSSGNAGNVDLPGGDAAVEAASAARSPEELKQAIREMTEIFQEQLPIIPLYFSPSVSAWTDNLNGGKEAFAINGEADLTSLSMK